MNQKIIDADLTDRTEEIQTDNHIKLDNIVVTEESKRRHTMGTFIVNNPKQFKICDCCETILVRGISICRVCNHYRFDTNDDNIVKHAQELMNKPQQNTFLE